MANSPKYLGSFVRVQQTVDPRRIVGFRFDDPPVFHRKAHILIDKALHFAGSIVTNHSVDRIPHRRRIDLSVWKVHLSVAFYGRNTFDRERQVCARTDQPYPVSTVHQRRQLIHRLTHFPVIHGAHVKEKIFKFRPGSFPPAAPQTDSDTAESPILFR